MAVASSLEMVSGFLQAQVPASARRLQELCEGGLPGEFVRAWSQRVDADLAATPLSPQEKDGLVRQSGEAAWAAVETNPRLAYGATLLIAAISPAFVAFWQLGDGDILTVSQDGNNVSRPIREDHTLIANETTSLCMASASRQFRTALFPTDVETPTPSLILLSTDGYANSFASPEAFGQVAPDLLALIHKQGFGSVCDQLEGWLNEASAEGSGDDVTVGLLWDRTAHRSTVAAEHTDSTTLPTSATSSSNEKIDDSPEQRPVLSSSPHQSSEGAPQNHPTQPPQ